MTNTRRASNMSWFVDAAGTAENEHEGTHEESVGEELGQRAWIGPRNRPHTTL